jgi:hypothetical protein
MPGYKPSLRLTRGAFSDKGIPRELERLRRMLVRALAHTAPLWEPIYLTYSGVHRAAHILKNEEDLRVEELRREYHYLLKRLV